MQKLFLTGLLLSLALPVSAEVDPKVADFCMKATDFAGCVETVTRGVSGKQKKDAEEGLRTWTRDDGTIIRMRVSSVVTLKNKGAYGRYIEYRYGLESKEGGANWIVQADCIDYTANWDQDNAGWYEVKDPDKFLRPGQESRKYPSAREAKAVLDEFCPLIEKLPKVERDIN